MKKRGQSSNMNIQHDCQIINHMTGNTLEQRALVCDTRLWFGKSVKVSVTHSQMGSKHAFLPPISFQSTSLTPTAHSTRSRYLSFMLIKAKEPVWYQT